MNTAHSSARPTHDYQPTIIENRLLIRRLAVQIAFLQNELKRSWIEFKTDPIAFAARARRDLYSVLKRFFASPNALYGCATATMAVTCLAIIVLFVHSTSTGVRDKSDDPNDSPVELLALTAPPPDAPHDLGTGGVSLSTTKPFRGQTGGGDHNPLPASFGKMPVPSVIPAPIPTTPPTNPTTLPVAGIDIDPARWRDVDARVYGDPDSKSQTPSNGPGNGGGIGNGDGVGIGPGTGSAGGGPGCGSPTNRGGTTGCYDMYRRSGPLSASEVDQRARLLFKPEPQYTEEARLNQVTGTVMLRVIFSSGGDIEQIRAVRTLPFGLTERAIAAARQIKFVPAMKNGQPVSVQMQLEYNFNLY